MRTSKMSSERSDESPVSGHSRRRTACKHCRQSKLRCDCDVPPCSRCNPLKISCDFDPEYKRVARFNKVEELEAQVQQLRNLVGNDQGLQTQIQPLVAVSTSPASALTSTEHVDASTSRYLHHEDGRNVGRAFHATPSSTALYGPPAQADGPQDSRALGSVRLSQPEISALFMT